MPRRSAAITVSNNTDLDLTLIADKVMRFHGSWTNDIEPPSTIPSKTCAGWEAESSGIGTGTEGVVTYQISNPRGDPPVFCQPELVFIHWNNPFVWRDATNPLEYWVTTTDVGQHDWPGGDRHDAGTNPPICTHEVFGIYSKANGIGGITWWDAVVNWPAILGLTALGEMDINLEFTIGLRLKGSVAQTVLATPCVGPQDIRTLSRTLGQPSLRKLFHM
jgi:hypothetical protein